MGRNGDRARAHNDPKFCREWDGLSVFDTYRGARWLGMDFGWRHGEFIAELDIPDGAPITSTEPDHKGHLLLYGADGEMMQAAHDHVPTQPRGPRPARPLSQGMTF